MVRWEVIALMAGACTALMVLERSGARTTLQADFKGDVKRETRWFSQYGQGACTLVAAALIWQLDRTNTGAALALIIATAGASILGTALKRTLGRVRPNREQAGRFLGPTLKHANFRESFPSSHSAAAIAFTVLLAHLYPAATVIFWTLGIGCAVLRYIMDAHWPSDVVAGMALGAACGNLVLIAFRF